MDRVKKLNKPTYSKLFHRKADRNLIGKIYLNNLLDQEQAAIESRKWSLITSVIFIVGCIFSHEKLGMLFGAIIFGYAPRYYHKEAIKLREKRLSQAHYLEISLDQDSM